jgi:hypothetical protein
MSRSLVAVAPAVLLAGGAQAHAERSSVPGEIELVVADDTALSPRVASYAYRVHTLDAVGNESGASNVVSLTLGGKSGGPGGAGSGSGGGRGGGKGKTK